MIDPPLTFGERVQGVVAPLIGRLPAVAQRLLSGERAVVLDGQTLDPQLQFIRSVRKKFSPYGYCEPTVPAARVRLHREALIFTRKRTRVGAVRDFVIPGDDVLLRVRHYVPEGAVEGSTPLLVYLHGGGFVVCDLDTHDEPCRILCRHAGVHVLSVEYRLAPEHPFPAGLHDASAALRWAQHNAASLGADPRCVAIGGDSAGGNLATVAARLAARGGAPPIAQLLIYPATDAVTDRPSRAMFGEGFFLDMRDVRAFARYYAGGAGVTPTNPLVSPLYAPDLSGMPPALVVTAGFDVLRDEGVAYADALREAGNSVRSRHFPAFGHAFINMTGVCPAAHRAMVQTAREWRSLIDNICA